MIQPSIDALRSPTLKHLRERWWDDEFTEFLTETLRPRPGNRILDVGCGTGGAEVRIGRLHVSQLELVGVDLKVAELVVAARENAAHNYRAEFVGGDACRLPFASGVFDSTYCVAVLQHIAEVESAVGELARVTREGGRIVAVEPDNAAHYAYSSSSYGAPAFALSAQFHAAARDNTDPAVGPRIAELFTRHGIEVVQVRLFPVSHVRLEPPEAQVWDARRAAVKARLNEVAAPVRAIGEQYLEALAAYERDARTDGRVFVEIQNTTLFATVGQKQ